MMMYNTTERDDQRGNRRVIFEFLVGGWSRGEEKKKHTHLYALL
jgi:hypothetical protein